MGIEQLTDPARLAALRNTGLLDSPPEEEFDTIARLAAHLLHAPVSLVSLVDHERQFFKSCISAPDGALTEGGETPLSHSICQYTVQFGQPVVVEDARRDPLLRSNGAVTDLGVVAYAGMPLISPEGHVYGSFCAIDMVPRRWTEQELRILRDLADAITAQIQLRAEIRERERAEQELRAAEAKLRSVLSSSQTVVFTLEFRPDGWRPTWVSDNVTRLFGYAPAETMKRGWWVSIIHPEDRERVLAADRISEGALAREYRIKNAAGQWRWILDDRRTGEVRADGSREVIGTWTDVTQQKEAEQQSRGEFIRLLLDRGSEVVTLLDQAGAIRYESPSITAVLGYTADELIGHSAFEFVHPEDLERTASQFSAVVAVPGREESIEFRFRHKDGSYRNLLAAAKNLLLDPQVRGVVVNSMDVTEHRKLQAEYTQSQKMDAIGRLASGVAHDFNNVLSVILITSELLLDTLSLEDPRREELAEIRHSAQRGSELTRHLLLFSRKQEVQARTVDPVVLISAFEQFIRRVIGGGVQLGLQVEASAGEVSIDPAQLEQVLLNLCVNARDAMPDGGSLSIICAGAEPGWTQIQVRDTGTGIPREVRERMFEPFFTTKEEGKGTGLGLATVYGIVKNAGGRIEVDSEPGQGTTFRVLLPNAE